MGASLRDVYVWMHANSAVQEAQTFFSIIAILATSLSDTWVDLYNILSHESMYYTFSELMYKGGRPWLILCTLWYSSLVPRLSTIRGGKPGILSHVSDVGVDARVDTT